MGNALSCDALCTSTRYECMHWWMFLVAFFSFVSSDRIEIGWLIPQTFCNFVDYQILAGWLTGHIEYSVGSKSPKLHIVHAHGFTVQLLSFDTCNGSSHYITSHIILIVMKLFQIHWCIMKQFVRGPSHDVINQSYVLLIFVYSSIFRNSQRNKFQIQQTLHQFIPSLYSNQWDIELICLKHQIEIRICFWLSCATQNQYLCFSSFWFLFH